MRTKTAVIGGGASGMMAAITAARQGAEVTVYEAKEKTGKKILATGNGKCNFTNLVQDDACYRGTDASFSRQIRQAFTVEDTLRFFQDIGIEPKSRNGYVYPNSEQAASVAEALQMELRARQVKIKHEPVVSIKNGENIFLVKTERDRQEYETVVLCCGSCAGMNKPEEFSGYRLAEQLGHHITPLFPALVQLRCKEKWLKTTAGVRTEGVIRMFADGKQVAEEKGELLFTDYGLSGIPVFQISRFAGEALYLNKKVSCTLDLLPAYSLVELEKLLYTRLEKLKKRTAEEMLTGLANHKLNYILLKEAGINPVADSKTAFSDEKIKQLAKAYKQLTCQVTALNPFANAQVCAGGVDTSEINNKTMESLLVSGLFFAGELVDVDGTCGGYNLQWAWSSGYVAGVHAARN